MRLRIYIEGGSKGSHADGLRAFKNGFKQHLVRLSPMLKALEVSPCGSTDETIRDFARAVREDEKDCIVALLADADASVAENSSPALHLQTKLDSGKVPQKARVNVFLMVQCMESWLVTDTAAIKKCFGEKTRTGDLPKHPDIEAVAKQDILAALAAGADGVACLGVAIPGLEVSDGVVAGGPILRYAANLIPTKPQKNQN